MKRITAGLAIAVLALAACDPAVTPRGQVPQGSPFPVFVSPSPLPSGSFGDGIWQVPGQIGYGAYRTTVPTTTRSCFWERRKDTGTALDSVIRNGVARGGQVVTIELKLGDAVLEVENCGTWTKIK